MSKFTSMLLALLLLSLTACAAATPTPPAGLDPAQAATQVAEIVSQSLTAAAPPTPPATATTANRVELDTSFENAASAEIMLLVGTLKLEGTDQAVAQTQAQTLLPLWTNLKTLSQSLQPVGGGRGQAQGNPTPEASAPGTDPQSQLSAFAKQIEAAMTPAQIQAINQLKLTQATALAFMEEQGIATGGLQAGEKQMGSQNQPGGGLPPEGTPPAGGGAPSGGANSAPPADNSSQPAGNSLPVKWIEALLQLLQTKSG